MSKKRNLHMGSSLDDFLKENGTLEELQVQAIKASSLQRSTASRGKRCGNGLRHYAGRQPKRRQFSANAVAVKKCSEVREIALIWCE